MRASSFWALALVGCLSQAAIASAEPLPDEASRLCEEGLQLRQQLRDVEALDRFEAAYHLRRAPEFLAQIGLAELALGRFRTAYQHLRQALSDRDDAWINPRRERLEGVLKDIESQFALLTVECNVPGATVAVDDQDIGAIPLAKSLRVDPGTRTLHVQAPGYVAVTRKLQLERGQHSRAFVELARAEPPAPIAVVSPPSAPVRVDPPAPIQAAAPSPTLASIHGTADRHRDPRWLVGTGLGAATVVAGGVTYAIAGGKAGDLRKDCYPRADDSRDAASCDDAERADRRKTVRTLDRTSLALISVGAATIVGSGIGYLLSSHFGAEQPAGGMRVSAALGSAHAMVFGTMEF